MASLTGETARLWCDKACRELSVAAKGEGLVTFFAAQARAIRRHDSYSTTDFEQARILNHAVGGTHLGDVPSNEVMPDVRDNACLHLLTLLGLGDKPDEQKK